MNLRWLLFDFADPALPVPFRRRLRTSLRLVDAPSVSPAMKRDRKLFGIAQMPAFAMLPLLLWFIRSTSIPIILIWLIVFLVWTSITYGIFCRRENRYRLRLEGYDVCIECSYWLRELGNDITKCPECGAERRPMPEQKP